MAAIATLPGPRVSRRQAAKVEARVAEEEELGGKGVPLAPTAAVAGEGNAVASGSGLPQVEVVKVARSRRPSTRNLQPSPTRTPLATKPPPPALDLSIPAPHLPLSRKSTPSTPSSLSHSPAPTPPPSHLLRSVRAPQQPSPIPFPPPELLEQEREGGEVFDEEDLRDEKLMAICAALGMGREEVEGEGGRGWGWALTTGEIGEICVERGWIRASPAIPPSSLIQQTLRHYLRRLSLSPTPRPSLIHKKMLQGSLSELSLAPILHPSAFADGAGARGRGTVWFLRGGWRGKVWEGCFERFERERGGMMGGEKGEGGVKRGRKKGERRKRERKAVVKDLAAAAGGKRRGSTAGTPVGAGTPGTDTPTSTQGRRVRLAPAPPAPQDEGLVVAPPQGEGGLKIRIKMIGRLAGPAAEREVGSPREEMMEMDGEEEEGGDGEDGDGGEEGSSEGDEEEEEEEDGLFENGRNGEYDSDDSMGSVDGDWGYEEASLPTPEEDLKPDISALESSASAAQQETDDHIQSQNFPSNPLDPIDFFQPRNSGLWNGFEDSSSEEEDEMGREGSPETVFGMDVDRGVGYGYEGWGGMRVKREEGEGEADVDTPATTPKGGEEWDKEEMMDEMGEGAGQAGAGDDLQNAVQVLGGLLPDFAASRFGSNSPSELPNPIEAAVIGDLGASGILPPAPPTTPIRETLAEELIALPLPLPTFQPLSQQRRISTDPRNLFKLSIPLPRMVPSSPLASPSLGHDNQPSQSRFLAMDDLPESPTKPPSSVLEGEEVKQESLMPVLEEMRSPMHDEEMDECVCRVEDEDEAMEMGSSSVGSPSGHFGELLDDVIIADHQQAGSGSFEMDVDMPGEGGEDAIAVKVARWNRRRTIEQMQGATEHEPGWVGSPPERDGMEQDIPTDVVAGSPLVFSDTEETDSTSSRSYFGRNGESTTTAAAAQLLLEEEQPLDALLGPESVGIDELDLVWGYVVKAANASQQERARRSNSEETAGGGKKSERTRKGGKRGRSHTIGEWGNIGVGSDPVREETKKEKDRFARVLLAKAAVAVSGRSQSRDTRAAARGKAKAKAKAVDAAESDDGVGIEDLEAAAKELWGDRAFTLQSPPPNRASLSSHMQESDDACDSLLAFASLHSSHGFDSECITPCLLSSGPTNLAGLVSPTATAAPVVPILETPTLPLAPSPTPPAATPVASGSSLPAPTSMPPPAIPAPSAASSSSSSASTSTIPTPVASKPRDNGRSLEVDPIVKIHPFTRAMVVDRIPVFSCVWNGMVLLRRIDSDYINITAFLKSISEAREPEISKQLATQSSNAVVKSDLAVGTSGVWIPLSTGRDIAKACSAPAPLLDVFLSDTLPDFFPSPLPNVKAAFKLGSNGRSSSCFGLPFGSIMTVNSFNSTKPQSSSSASSSTTSASTIKADAGVQPLCPAKRTSPAAHQPDGEKPAKRRKSVAFTDVERMEMSSKSVPLGKTVERVVTK